VKSFRKKSNFSNISFEPRIFEKLKNHQSKET